MNKLNFFLLLIVGLGMVCGCNLSYKLGDNRNNSNQNRRDARGTGEKSATNKKQSSETDGDSSADDETRDSDNDLDNDADSGDNSRRRDAAPGDEIDSSGDAGDAAKLAGKWAWSRTGSTTYGSGGTIPGSNGSRFTYEFSESGEVEFTGIMNVMQGTCRMQIFKSRKGQANLNGDTLTINWEPANFSRDDSCDTAGNYEKTLPAETETLKVAFKNDAGQNQLCLTGKDETCFSPAE